MKTINIGITGQSGFIGTHLTNVVNLCPEFRLINFSKEFFRNPEKLRSFAEQCDVIVHLAGLSRHPDGDFLYQTNVKLTQTLMDACSGKQKILLASTTHDAKDLPYHASKRKSRELLEQYGNAVTLRMANTFGPGSRPFYNSAVSTFCQMAANGETPERIDPVTLYLIDIHSLCRKILKIASDSNSRGEYTISHTDEISLPLLWKMLTRWKNEPLSPAASHFETQLHITFQSYNL